MNFNQINGLFYSSEDRSSMGIIFDIIIDKTSIEVFVDGGVFLYTIERKVDSENMNELKFFENKIG